MSETDDDLVERAARAAKAASTPLFGYTNWNAVARAVLAQAPPPAVPAPITAEDVRAAERAWWELPTNATHERAVNRVAFVADYLNRRTETKES